MAEELDADEQDWDDWLVAVAEFVVGDDIVADSVADGDSVGVVAVADYVSAASEVTVDG